MAIAAAALGACDNEFERPPMVVPSSAWEANTTIEDFKAEYWNTVETAPQVVGLNADGDSIIVKGRVCSSDKSGNIFKYLIIQGESEALALTLDFYDIYESYKFGQEIYVNLSGLTIGGYSGLMCVGNGTDDRGRVARAAETLFATHAQVNGLPATAMVDTVVTSIPTVEAAKASAEGLQQWQSRLVRFDNVRFEDAGEPFAVGTSSTSRYIIDDAGNRLLVYNSTYSDFKDQLLPSGNGSVVGIMSYFGTTWQLLLIDAEGCIGFNGVTPPVFSPAAGTVKPGTEITISCATEGAEIHYTLDGSDPTISSQLYTDPIVLEETTTIKAIATLAGHEASKITSARFVVSDSAAPEGDGSQESPYTIAQIIAMAPTSTSTAVAEGVWGTGYIVGYIPTGGASTTIDLTVFGTSGSVIASNLVIAPTADETDYNNCIAIQLSSGTDIRAALNLVDHPENIGKLVKVKGDVMKYCNAPGLKNLSAYELDGEGGGTTPTPPAGDAIFSETFLNGNLGSFASSVETSGSWTGWRANTSNPLCAIANSYVEGTNEAATAWLYSPAISLEGYTSASLSFEQAFGFYFPTTQEQFCTVNIRVSGGEWQSLTLTNFPEKGQGNWTGWVENTLDISSYAGKTIELAFKYVNDGKQSVAWEIRNLTVNGSK